MLPFSTRIPSCPSLIIDRGPHSIINEGEDGILVENGNPSALAQGILSLVNDTVLCKKMSEVAVQNVQRFNIEHIATQWRQMFESL